MEQDQAVKPSYQSPAVRPAASERLSARDGLVACGLILGFLGLYHANGDFLPGNDAVGSIYLAVSVLTEGNLSFTPDEMPRMFTWTLATDDGRRVVRIGSWEQEAPGGTTWGALRRAGRLTPREPGYYIVPSVDPRRLGYTNAFGPGAGLTGAPFFAVQSMFVDRWAENRAALWYGGKFVASLCVAVSVAVVFLAASLLTPPWPAVVIAAAYGAGTCVWSVCSQTLWTSGPNVMFLSLGAYSLLRVRQSDWWAAGCAVAIACGVICRPTTSVVVITIGVYLTAVALRRCRDRSAPVSLAIAARPLLIYVLAGLPLAILLGWYNWHYSGSPLQLAEMAASRRVAEAKIGSPDVWGGSLLEGFYGLLVSPSRGMLVYSPVLVFGFWGLFRLWREPRLGPLRPLSVAVVILLLLHSKWFDWNGGWSFGYRLMVDSMPLVALCGVAVVEQVRRRKALVALFLVSLVWSVGVQVIGAHAYNVTGWNNRRAYLVRTSADERPFLVLDRNTAKQYATEGSARVRKVHLDVDRAANRRRLWSIRDSQLLYYLTHFAESRRQKKQLIETRLKPP